MDGKGFFFFFFGRGLIQLFFLTLTLSLIFLLSFIRQDGVEPREDELVFDKTGSNAFVCTSMDHVLRNMSIQHLICVGVLTDEFVAGTVKSACDLGYNVTVLSDGCCAATVKRHNAAMETMSRFADRICSVKEWINEMEGSNDSKRSRL